jgi:hypothetical protein
MNKNIKYLFLTLLSIFLMYEPAQAKSLSTSADIKIRNTLTITEVQKLNFGTIEKPTTNVAVQITNAGISGAGTTATLVNTTTIKEGRYTIAGSSLNTINISATNNGNITGLTFTAITADYGTATGLNLLTGAANQAAPAATGTLLKIGGTLTVASTVTEGDYAPGFTITANYN